MGTISFRPSEIEDDVLQKINSERDGRALKMARPILSRFVEFSNDEVFRLDEPVKLRNTIFRFYQKQQTENYKDIKNHHLMPMKKLLEYIAEEAQGEELWNAWMLKDTLSPRYFGEKETSHYVDRLDNKILEEKELEALRGSFDGEDKFILEMFLETTAKIGIIAALEHKNFPDSKFSEKTVDLRKQYVEQEGLKNLDETRSRSLEISEELATMYFRIFDSEEGYLFGEDPKRAHSHLRSRLREINGEFGFQVNPSILRDTGAYIKSKEMNIDELKELMGIETTSKIERYQQVRDKRNS